MPKKAIIIVDLPFTSPEFQLIWAEWMAFRSERRLPAYKPTGLKRTLAALVRDSGNSEETAIAMIIQSIEKNWQGLFPIKNNQINNNGRTGSYFQNIGFGRVQGHEAERPL
jgi:hypothetical protein